jgi:hypothetical protein
MKVPSECFMTSESKMGPVSGSFVGSASTAFLTMARRSGEGEQMNDPPVEWQVAQEEEAKPVKLLSVAHLEASKENVFWYLGVRHHRSRAFGPRGSTVSGKHRYRTMRVLFTPR